MPKALEHKLENEAAAEHLKGKAKSAYVYGTMRKTGWKPTPKKPTPEASTDAEHESEGFHEANK